MKILRVCEHCGKEFFIYESSLKHSNSSGKFCCRKCYNEYQKTLTREKNNNFNSVLVTCAECGKEFYLIKSKVGMYKNTFCSKECKNNYMHNYIGGDKNCNWKGGHSSYRGDFESVKSKYFQNCSCALCGTKEHIHIHHIIPYRLTQDNSLSNLIPLCAKHLKIGGDCMAKNEFANMTPEMRSYYGKLGAEKSIEVRRQRKEMRETLDVLLKMPMKKGKVYSAEDIKCFADLKGKNITIDQAVMVCLIQKALKGDLNAIAMVRDTVGEKPSDKVEVKDVTPVIISGEDELSE